MVGENENFSKIPLSPGQIQQILTSPEGLALIQLLQRDGGKGIRSAAKAIRAGDADGAKKALSPLLQNTDGAELADQLQQKLE